MFTFLIISPRQIRSLPHGLIQSDVIFRVTLGKELHWMIGMRWVLSWLETPSLSEKAYSEKWPLNR